MFDWLVVFFNIGKTLALTPPYNHPVSHNQKVHTFLLLTLITIFKFQGIVYREYSRYYISAKVALNLLSDLNLLLCIYASTLSVVALKKERWRKLMSNIRILMSVEDRTEIERKVKLSVLNLCFDWVITSLVFLFWVKVYTFKLYASMYTIQFIEYYFIFAHLNITTFILNTIKLQYRTLNNCLRNRKERFVILSKIERTLHFLRDTVDIFNDVFGWPLTLITIFTTLYLVNTLDYIFEVTLKLYKDMELRILTNVALVGLVFFRTAKMIITCDLIVKEADDLLDKSHALRRDSHAMRENERSRLRQFSEAIQQNFPKFSAARFFQFDRSTILSILGTATTFFIVMIQFHNDTNNEKTGIYIT